MNEIFKLMGTIGLSNSEANKGIDETTNKAEGSAGKITGFFKNAAVAIGSAFAAKKLIDFGGLTVQAAAGAKAVQAQFEQVFGESEATATDAVNGMAKEYGMLPNRLKGSFTALTSKFKGLGMSTESAMEQAGTATGIAADAAAFYDKSMEDTQSSLNSFVNGSYEAGEGIGLFANETQMAGWAAQNLGVDWSTLDEAGKQVARLEFAQAMQEAAGATGQASRESGSYENQMGNLKQAWTDFKALVGGPLLEPVVNGLRVAAEWLQTAGGKVQEFQAWFVIFRDEVANSTAFQTLQEVFQGIADKFTALRESLAESGFLDNVKQVFVDIKDAILGIDFVKLVEDVGAFLEKWAPLIAGVVAGIAAFKIITAAISAWQTIMLVAQGVMFLISNAGVIMGAVIGAINWPIVALVAAIGLLVAAGVWLYQNWDMVKAKAIEIWGAISSYLSGLWNGIKSTASGIFNGIKSTVTGAWDGINSATSNVWDSVKTTISNEINGAKNAVKGAIDAIKGFFSFKVSWPNIPMPHFSVNPSGWEIGDLLKGSIPSLGVDFYANGGIMDGATIFGSNGRNMMVGGEAGPEAILPLNRETLGKIGQGIAETMNIGANASRSPVFNIANLNVMDKGDQRNTLAQLEFMAGI